MSRDVAERKLADLAEKQWQDYKSRFQPLEHLYATRLTADRPAEKSRAISGAVANAQNKAAELSGGITKGLGVAGLSPSSGRSIGAKGAMYRSLGTAAGAGAGGADVAIGNKKAAGVAQAVKMGRGMQQNSIAGLTSSAIAQSQNNAIEDLTKRKIASSNWGLLGNLAGLGLGYASYKYGNRDPNERSMRGMNLIGP